MLVVDESGKLEKFPLFVAVARLERKHKKLLNDLRKKVRKRHPGIASRKRIKASDLTESELKWFVRRIDFAFRVVQPTPLQFRTFKRLYKQRRKWKFEFLVLCYYSAVSGFVDDHEKILLDKDYDQKSMEFMIKRLDDILKRWDRTNAEIMITDYTNEYLALADLIAGSARKGLISTIKPDILVLAEKYFRKDQKI